MTPSDESPPSHERSPPDSGPDDPADREADHELPFWRRPETVEKFADREPDHRLRDLLERYDDPVDVAVLDLGCAGGRNTVLLARGGFDVRALDPSPPMVERTRERVAEVLGREEARGRVRRGRMEDLGAFDDGRFDLVVALGVHHNADSRADRRRALAETARVLQPGGLLLLSVLGPGSEPRGEPLRPRDVEAPLWEGFSSGPLYLVGPEELDRELAENGLLPETPTESVRTDTEEGYRITINALYRKRAGG